MLDTTRDDHRLSRLIEVGRSLLSELDLDVVLDRVLETARELTGARYAALGILDERRRELAQFLTRGVDEATHRAIGDLPRGRGILGLLIEEPQPLRLADLGEHPRSYGFPPGHPPMRGFLGVPILIRGEAWGNLYLTEKAGGDFDQDDEATATIARAVGGETDLERVLELIVKRGRALVEARDVLILLLEGDRLRAAAGAGSLSVPEGLSVALAESPLAELLAGPQAHRLADPERRIGLRLAELGVADAEAALMVPLVYRGTTLGALLAFDRLTGDVGFTRDDEQLLEAFAASAATAVATAKTVEADRLRKSLEAAEAERRRWARELHDETLQALGGLKVLLSGASRLDDAGAMRDAMGEAVGHVSAEIESLRALIAELRPPALDQLGL